MSKDFDKLSEQVSDLRGKDVERAGFEAGLLRTRGDMDSTPTPGDNFLIGYRRGEEARTKIIAAAVAQVAPKYNSTLVLETLVEECDKLLVDVSTGSFDTDHLDTMVARAKVHLADTRPADESGEYIRPFEADTRLLAYFGTLHRAATKVAKTAEAGVDDEEIAELNQALVLPPDIDAAIEGPRGRHDR